MTSTGKSKGVLIIAILTCTALFLPAVLWRGRGRGKGALGLGFLRGLFVIATGVALPLMVFEFGLSAMEKGAVGAATLFGILVGATALVGLSDRFGRKRMLIVEMAL